MSKFKVGDRVRNTKRIHSVARFDIPVGTKGTVILDDGDDMSLVKFDGFYDIFITDDELQPVEFEKDDLKPGYVVEMRSGRLALILPYRDVRKEKDALIMAYDAPKFGSWDPVDPCLTDNLLWMNSNGADRHDIIRVYGFSSVGGHAISAGNTSSRPLLWERKETKKMTLAEVCKALGYDVEIVKDGATDA